ncbi:MAG: bifunctional tetrahydrofolate synthase/dihydrofolate synthase, partial [Gammaproteobacteria bacterium]|nr:bifunctional tetrahydrofolate synthase/dihydrofolate synthase [Gammaproteobacteria bacterium]
AGLKPLVYTSPHFIDYKERLKFDGHWLTDAEHVAAFEAVENARESEQLTYFEFATLSALKMAELLPIDVLILETGLGGRLDAVNVIKADIAIITTVDYDHQDWLGDDLVSIAREKAGIAHKGKQVIIADPEFPLAIIHEIELRTDQVFIADRDFLHLNVDNGWSWENSQLGPWSFEYLTFPFANASAALQAWFLLRADQELTESYAEQAFSEIALSGRFETVAQSPDVILDVAHNPQAFRAMSELLNNQSFNGKTHIVLGLLEDKNAKACLTPLLALVDQWYLSDLEGTRGRSAINLKQLLNDSDIDENQLQCYSSSLEAYKAACLSASEEDRILVTGSFYTVSPVLKLVRKK